MYNLAYAVFVNNEQSIANEESGEWFRESFRAERDCCRRRFVRSDQGEGALALARASDAVNLGITAY